MAGAEVHHVYNDFDLIVVTPNQTMLSIEVKSAFKPFTGQKRTYQFKVGSAVVDFYVFLAVDIERLIVRKSADVQRNQQVYFSSDEFSEEEMSSGIDIIIGS